MTKTARWLSISLLLVSLIGATAASQTVKLEMLHGWTSFREPWVLEMLDAFMEEYPSIEVDSRVLTGSQIYNQFLTLYAGGVAPDVVMIKTDHAIILADQGALIPLDEFLERDGISLDIFVPAEITMSQWEGKTYGLPMRPGGESLNILYYNRDIFRQAGLDPDNPPATWDMLTEVSKRLIRYDGEGNIVLNPIRDVTNGANYHNAAKWIYAGGAEFLSPDMRTVTFGSPEAIDTADWVWSFRSEVYRTFGDDLVGYDDFIAGNTAMALWGAEGFSTIWDSAPDLDFGAAPRPKREGAPYIGANVDTWVYVIPSTSKNPEAAWELIKWLTIREETAGWFMRIQGRASAVREFNFHPEYAEINPYVHVLGQILEQVAPLPTTPVNRDIGNLLAEAFRKATRGQEAARAAFEDAAARAQEILDTYWRERGQ